MSQESPDILTNESQRGDTADSLPFPFNQRAFCRYEPIEKRIEEARVLVVDNLLRDQGDLSDVARSQWGETAAAQLKRERQIAKMAGENRINNGQRLVKSPTTQV